MGQGRGPSGVVNGSGQGRWYQKTPGPGLQPRTLSAHGHISQYSKTPTSRMGLKPGEGTMFLGSHMAQKCPGALRGQRAQPQSLTTGLGTTAWSGLLSADARVPRDLRAARPRPWLTRPNQRRSSGGEALSSSGSRAGLALDSVERPPPPGPGPEMSC